MLNKYNILIVAIIISQIYHKLQTANKNIAKKTFGYYH